MIETRTGKCTRCRIRYEWPRTKHRGRSGQPACPRCGDFLEGTNNMLRWRVSRLVPWYGFRPLRDHLRKRRFFIHAPEVKS